MSLTYYAGGATTALTVVGLCELDPKKQIWKTEANGAPDMLFTGDGEAFNVSYPRGQHIEVII